MPRTPRLIHQIKSSWSDEEYTELLRVAEARKLPPGACVRLLVNDYLRTQLTRSETLLLEAVQELQANYMDVIRLSLNKQLSVAALHDATGRNRRRRRDLAQEFLATIRARGTTSEADEDED